MITGAHAIVFTKDVEATRAFFGDVLGLSSVDAGAGWLIFALPTAELAAHPAEDNHHEIYLTCDDVDATVADLKAKGATFARPITDTDWGRMTALELPDGDELAIYEPRHTSPLSPRL